MKRKQIREILFALYIQVDSYTSVLYNSVINLDETKINDIKNYIYLHESNTIKQNRGHYINNQHYISN